METILENILNLIGRIEGKPLEKELIETRKSYSKSELNEAVIVEKQHVAGFKYDNVIDEVMWHIRKYCLSQPYDKKKMLGITGGWWKFQIPEEITKKFDFVDNFVIDVEIEDFKFQDERDDMGRGYKYTNIDDRIVGDILNHAHILLKGVSYNGKLIDYSIRNILYHELTHAYETFKRERNIKKIGGRYYNHSLKYHEIIDRLKNSGDDMLSKELSDVYYRLFNESELSAAASSTYAYLKSVNGKRVNLLKDIKKTQGYYEYNVIKQLIEEFKTVTDEKWWNKKRLILWGNNGSTWQEFKNWFLLKCQNYLKKYFHYMMSAAALYYDNTENKHPQDNVVITK